MTTETGALDVPICPACGGRWIEPDAHAMLGNTLIVPGGAVALPPKQAALVGALNRGMTDAEELCHHVLYVSERRHECLATLAADVRQLLYFHRWGIRHDKALDSYHLERVG